MTIVETIKNRAERLTGWRRPAPEQLAALPRRVRPASYRFRDDGYVPNNPRWPFLLYRGAVVLPRTLDPAAVWEDLFEENRWGDTWRGEIYDYVHYHSRIHEVLGIARGSATVRIGGNHGRVFKVKAGDALLIPAGTGHEALQASASFMAVGAYPPRGTYDECAPTTQDYAKAIKTVGKVARPRTDPVHGADGPLLTLWKA